MASGDGSPDPSGVVGRPYNGCAHRRQPPRTRTRVLFEFMASSKLLPVRSRAACESLRCCRRHAILCDFAPIFNDSLANLVKSLVKQRGRMVRRIALRNFCREELFDSALTIFVYLSLVVRHLQTSKICRRCPRRLKAHSRKCTTRHKNASLGQAPLYKRELESGPPA